MVRKGFTPLNFAQFNGPKLTSRPRDHTDCMNPNLRVVDRSIRYPRDGTDCMDSIVCDDYGFVPISVSPVFSSNPNIRFMFCTA
jgi:hypothetical protein